MWDRERINFIRCVELFHGTHLCVCLRKKASLVVMCSSEEHVYVCVKEKEFESFLTQFYVTFWNIYVCKREKTSFGVICSFLEHVCL